MVHDVIIAVRSAPLEPRTRHLALLLATYVNDKTFLAYPSVATLAHELGVCRSTVQRDLQRLRALGVVRVESRQVVGSDGQPQPAGGRGASTRYRFQLDMLAALSPERAALVRPFPSRRGGGKGRTGDAKGPHWDHKRAAPVRPNCTRPHKTKKSSGADAPPSPAPELTDDERQRLEPLAEQSMGEGQFFHEQLEALTRLAARDGLVVDRAVLMDVLKQTLTSRPPVDHPRRRHDEGGRRS
jgi:DNA-binding transcriptional MocR family regulator